MALHQQLGKAGEEIAQAHLLSKDYTIIATNYRIGRLDLDIVATKDDMLVIVEVRTRSTAWYQQPEATVDRRKMQHIASAALGVVRWLRWQGETRFDIIAVVGPVDGNYQVDHFEDAFRP
ncbi:MAG: YraN family protein [Bacteroidales bacterium]|nr:YraN family protein [Bacteroidales bacterium]